jgi:hypothetical protein
MAPLVIGRCAWDREIMQRDLAVYAVWVFQPMPANFAVGLFAPFGSALLVGVGGQADEFAANPVFGQGDRDRRRSADIPLEMH